MNLSNLRYIDDGGQDYRTQFRRQLERGASCVRVRRGDGSYAPWHAEAGCFTSLGIGWSRWKQGYGLYWRYWMDYGANPSTRRLLYFANCVAAIHQTAKVIWIIRWSQNPLKPPQRKRFASVIGWSVVCRTWMRSPRMQFAHLMPALFRAYQTGYTCWISFMVLLPRVTATALNGDIHKMCASTVEQLKARTDDARIANWRARRVSKRLRTV